VDADLLRQNFAVVAGFGIEEVASRFYATLFVDEDARAAKVIDLFPEYMAPLFVSFVATLADYITHVDDMAYLEPKLKALGIQHRWNGAIEPYYPVVGRALIATLKHFTELAHTRWLSDHDGRADGAPEWTEELEAAWQEGYWTIAQPMIDAAAEDEKAHPPFWNGTVISHERRSQRFAVLTIKVAAPPPYEGVPLLWAPGQSVKIEHPRRPRVPWLGTPAHPADHPWIPRDTITFHVQLKPGGQVSPVLVRGPVIADGVRIGDRVRVSACVGGLQYAPTGRDVVLAAGGAGLAPAKAILLHLATFDRPPRVDLIHGTRTVEDLYDSEDLAELAARLPWLKVTLCAEDPQFPGMQASVPEALGLLGPWKDRDFYVCGSTDMTAAARRKLLAMGIPDDRIRTEDFGGIPS
jgi:NAD(P)H-flavin reductase/hemoglobin-like flavoprotein